ncbi:hypothetical protein Scep_019381 [Stephania cephalantha]|uniref:Uncharacterized protein n=1 Tax=Stephania cephalantha TaxID=152367 RepID=A0AAP0NLA6_9MAGN
MGEEHFGVPLASQVVEVQHSMPMQMIACPSVKLLRIISFALFLSSSDGKFFRSQDQKGVEIQWAVIDKNF